jgi:YbbR domain-containing protein
MTLHRFIFEDFGLKLFSLGVALLIWTAVHFAVEKEADLAAMPLTRISTRNFPDRPVLVVSFTADVRGFKAKPSHVDVTVLGEATALNKLQEKDIHVIVELTNVTASAGLRQRVEVSTLPGGTLHVRANPEEVELILPK